MTPPRPPAFSRLNPEHSAEFHKADDVKPERSHRALEITLFVVFAVLMVLGGLALYTSYSPTFRKLPNSIDAGIKRDRINILLIGVGGETHPGGGKDLADSIMLVSLKPSTRQVAMVSVPRDLYVPIKGHGTHRINRAHEIGEQSGYPGAGPGLLAATVSSTLGQPVDGFARVDFAAFKKMIDDLGGVDIEVHRSFYDYLFQDGFVRGPQHMNGDRALRYARYRYVLGDEGDNYAREARQQQVIAALRERLQQRSPSQIAGLVAGLRTLSSATDTNLSPTQLIWLYSKFRGVQKKDMENISLKPYLQIFQLSGMSDTGEAVRPPGQNFDQIRTVVGGVFQQAGAEAQRDQVHLAAGRVGDSRQ